MRVVYYIAALWPGLVQAWCLGRLSGLALAISFAAALNLALIHSLVWPGWPFPANGFLSAAAWVLVLGLWIVGIAMLRADWGRLFPARAAEQSQLNEWLQEAQSSYLKGHWMEAEALTSRILAREPGDVEARLLLASIQRRSGQHQAAARSLDELGEQPGALRWRFEIAAERRKLAAGAPAEVESAGRNGIHQKAA